MTISDTGVDGGEALFSYHHHSPRRLNLQRFRIPGTAPRKTLDIWPALLIPKG